MKKIGIFSDFDGRFKVRKDTLEIDVSDLKQHTVYGEGGRIVHNLGTVGYDGKLIVILFREKTDSIELDPPDAPLTLFENREKVLIRGKF